MSNFLWFLITDVAFLLLKLELGLFLSFIMTLCVVLGPTTIFRVMSHPIEYYRAVRRAMQASGRPRIPAPFL
ncbi:hypothetical protein MPTK1_5g21910 [Marchantia polymorpha subsp. ruderalis]|uniref:Uncharacterized protein n=2 Tax=Marchantia polymorpha TaxID=3197 RepID=A0AAF6BKY0_MARPO|nr:hypothetical protein MARPO_0106s0008 [Marchantia polymorpha]BBN12664.1 hypothetical protein Mp_5g21910 [Marchantia polymorpha subsp. ruderalis]|eukprot:PTQ31804.1 hypothetical protein MARPO_0106s0008 [Marchantia polymorpha]